MKEKLIAMIEEKEQDMKDLEHRPFYYLREDWKILSAKRDAYSEVLKLLLTKKPSTNGKQG